MNSNVLNKSGLLCLKLTSHYRNQTKFILSRKEQAEGETLEVKLRKKQLNKNLDLGSFLLDTSGTKYYRIYHYNEDGHILHAVIDSDTGTVYKPNSNGYLNKNLSWDIDQCIRVADWKGYYLNADPVV